jgi:hypothetical protein
VSSPADRSSPESAEWTSGSPGRDGGTSSSLRLTPTAAQSSRPDSPAYPSTTTSNTSLYQDSQFGVKEYPTAGALRAGRIPEHQMIVQRPLMSSPSGAPAKTSPSQASDEDLTASEAGCSGKPCESSTLFDPEPYSWRTWKGSCQATVDGTSHSSWTRWPSAGIGGATGFSTRSTSVSPSVDGEFSWSASLTTILVPNASERYSLSQKAAAGILRRASRRGRTLPPALEQALRAVAETAR